MMYVDGLIFFLGLSLLLYFLLGGADFGAGILELLIGDKGISTVNRAIAPVWEANHIWLIIVVVILFNGFPTIYSSLSTALHLPILLALIGIILRGTAFTFRHYDVEAYSKPKIYTTVFRYSSAFTVFCFGLIVAPLLTNTLLPAPEAASFYAYYVAPWLNAFGLATGFFVMTLCAYISAIYLLGEVESETGYLLLKRKVNILFGLSFIAGGCVFGISLLIENGFTQAFTSNTSSIFTASLATLAVPLVFWLIGKRKLWSMRIAVAAQMTFVLLAVFLLRFPLVMEFTNGTNLNLYRAAAPPAVLSILFWSLVAGMCLILPALYYLFKVFKVDRQ